VTRYVAFLRGINVGGRVVKKDRLREAFAGLGFQDAETFRQSGNVVFETGLPRAELAAKIEGALGKALGYEVAVLVRAVDDLARVVELDPFKGIGEEGASFLVTMLPAPVDRFPLSLPATIPKSTAQVISAKGSEVFSVTHGGGEGALPNPFIESRLKVKATTRNMNVIREVVERFGPPGA
jgi:uncharacterized protein (DUF1697 family)